jgi:hypothetical protein
MCLFFESLARLIESEWQKAVDGISSATRETLSKSIKI